MCFDAKYAMTMVPMRLQHRCNYTRLEAPLVGNRGRPLMAVLNAEPHRSPFSQCWCLQTPCCNSGLRWLLPPEISSEHRVYPHKIHACTHSTRSEKSRRSQTPVRGRTAMHQLLVSIFLRLTEVYRHADFCDGFLLRAR